MARVLEIADGDGDGGLAACSADACATLEDGGLVLLPARGFPLSPAEAALADPASLAPGSKNVSLDPATGRLGGHALEGDALSTATAMAVRYADFAQDLVAGLLPRYAPHLQRRRTSFRPAAIEQRALSPRKDDKRLHVDAFPSSPVQGRRILRVFTNVDPGGSQRVWRVGEGGFDAFAGSFAPRIPALRPRGSGAGVRVLMARLGLTRGVRTAYDQAMLELHDTAKLDEAWQASAPRTELDLPAGATWIVFTDACLHAAMKGQHAFEQTFLLPVEAMADPARSPLRALERIAGRPLV